jgi:hypothetical protein
VGICPPRTYNNGGQLPSNLGSRCHHQCSQIHHLQKSASREHTSWYGVPAALKQEQHSHTLAAVISTNSWPSGALWKGAVRQVASVVSLMADMVEATQLINRHVRRYLWVRPEDSPCGGMFDCLFDCLVGTAGRLLMDEGRLLPLNLDTDTGKPLTELKNTARQVPQTQLR